MSQPSDAELTDLLRLALTAGIGPQRLAALLGRFGEVQQVLRASETDLAAVPGIGARLAAALRASAASSDAVAELARVRAAGVTIRVRGREGYPPLLAEAPGAPLMLFTRGDLRQERGVALVGTRHPTAYGKRMAARLAEGLARAGLVVVSGMARGIDGVAHTAALDAGGQTVAVLAGGLGSIYPPEHLGLSERIAGNGALVTESVMSQTPLKGLFPARNRIISGLSQVVVIVQAAEKSGALITAEHAAEQGRVVLAVPGLADEPDNEGCHKLIRDGAGLCRSVGDILEELDGIPASPPPRHEPPREAPAPPVLNPEEARAWGLLGGEPRSMDELAQHLGMPIPQLAGLLMMMEMRRLVRRLPGNRYERV